MNSDTVPKNENLECQSPLQFPKASFDTPNSLLSKEIVCLGNHYNNLFNRYNQTPTPANVCLGQTGLARRFNFYQPFHHWRLLFMDWANALFLISDYPKMEYAQGP